MCWTSNNLRIKTAKKNIPVWKVVYPTNYDFPNRCCSLYTRFVYVKGDLEMTPMNFDVRMSIVNGNGGFHSYSDKVSWRKIDDFISVFKEKTLFHSEIFITKYHQEDAKIAKFHIPKGYRYAENNEGEIISSAIIFDNFID